MGCGCNKGKKDEETKELMNEILQNIEEIQNDEKKMQSIIKIQRYFRKTQLKSNKPPQIKQEIINNNSLNNSSQNIKDSFEANSIPKKLPLEIPQEELTTLLKEYPPLSDNVKVKINGPVQDNNIQSVYLGEWDFKKNLKHGRGIEYWSEGSKYYGYWIAGKANIRGKLIHADGDKYEGEWLNAHKITPFPFTHFLA